LVLDGELISAGEGNWLSSVVEVGYRRPPNFDDPDRLARMTARFANITAVKLICQIIYKAQVGFG
jgi:hypothetical protein